MQRVSIRVVCVIEDRLISSSNVINAYRHVMIGDFNVFSNVEFK
jgi:hypothetical protein